MLSLVEALVVVGASSMPVLGLLRITSKCFCPVFVPGQHSSLLLVYGVSYTTVAKVW